MVDYDKYISDFQRNLDFILVLKEDIEQSKKKSAKKYLPEVERMVKTHKFIIQMFEERRL